MTSASPAPGILPSQAIDGLIQAGAIASLTPFDLDQVQPASLDLRLGERAWRVRASFLPGLGRKVTERLPDVAMHQLDLTQGAVFEGLRLHRRAAGAPWPCRAGRRLRRANPKSSTGRVDVFVRLLTDHQPAFDDVASGYNGPMYMEIAPQTFSVLARTGTRLNQLRLKRGRSARA